MFNQKLIIAKHKSLNRLKNTTTQEIRFQELVLSLLQPIAFSDAYFANNEGLSLHLGQI